jgi:hypothetical protein
MRRDAAAIADSITASTPTYSDPSTFPIATPWSTGELNKVLFDDIFPDGVLPPNGRTAAMRIPAVKRARNLVCSAIAGMPLKVADAAGPLEPAIYAARYRWLHRTDHSSPRMRTVWTVDDLMFYGASAWWRDNGDDGFPLHATRLNRGDWTIDADLRVRVHDQVVSDEQVIVIPALDEGVLALGSDAIADTKTLYAIVRDRLANPVTTTELHQVSGSDMTDTERDAMLDHWRTARSKPGGTVGFTNRHIEAKFHGQDSDATMLIEARNAAAVDMARMIGVSAGMLDATTPKASLNYETRTGRNQEFVDLDLAAYMLPIESRLSMDDCVPNGKRVFFERTDTTAPAPSPTGPAHQD